MLIVGNHYLLADAKSYKRIILNINPLEEK